MRVQIIYATNSSGTLVASNIVRETLISHGHEVDLLNADKATPEDLKNKDLVIFSSCTWEVEMSGKHIDGHLQQNWQKFADSLRGKKYPGQKFAVFGLGDKHYRQFGAAADILKQLVADIGGERLGEALKLDGFYFEYKENKVKLQTWAEDVMNQAQ